MLACQQRGMKHPSSTRCSSRRLNGNNTHTLIQNLNHLHHVHPDRNVLEWALHINLGNRNFRGILYYFDFYNSQKNKTKAPLENLE